ncbi:putative ribonuclease H-like domain-containing protein, partial [Tanacetum coccineum]
KVVKERDELKLKIEKWEGSSNNLTKILNSQILNSQMSAHDKNGLGFGTQMDDLSNKSETISENNLTVFEVRSSDDESTIANDRFTKSNEYHAVPPPITGNPLTPRADISFAGLDEYAFRNKIIESKTTETNKTVGTTNETTIAKPTSVNETVVSKSKINRDEVIIEDWTSDDEDDVCADKTVSSVKPNVTQAVRSQTDKSGQTSQKQGIGFKKTYDDLMEALWPLEGYPKGVKYGKGKIKTANLDFDDVYFVDELNLDLKNIVPSRGITCLYANATADESKLWHRRLGHVNFKNINKLVKGHLVRGLPSKVFVNDHTCVAYKKGKQHKASCKAKLDRIIRKPLELLHMDLFGPVSIESINKKRYCLVVTDDFSRFSWVFFLATKDETSKILCNLIIGLEKQLNHNVKIIRCDNGIEFKNYVMNEFCAKKGIKREFSVARTQSRMVIVDAGTQDSYVTCSFGKDNGPYVGILLPSTINLIEARIPAKDVVQDAQEQPSENASPDKGIQVLEDVFDKEGQHQMPADEQVWQDELEMMVTQELVANAMNDESRQAFEEKEENYISKEGKLKLPVLTQLYAASTSTGANADESSFVYLGGKIPIDASTLPNADLPIDPNMPDLEDASDTLPNDGIFNGAYDDDEDVGAVANFNNMDNTIAVKEPKTISQALKDESWVEAMQEELLQFKLQQVWILVDLPFRKKAIGTKRIGHYDEVFALVARIEAIRLFLAFDNIRIYIYQMDVLPKSAILYGTIEEEVYVHQPPGFVDPAHPNKVYKVVKALYGLHQAPRAWYETLSSFLLENGFRRGTIDKTLFIKKNKSDIMLVQVYVDDIIFGSTKKSMCTEFEEVMHKRFQMSSMGELTFFLGLQVKQQPDGIFISQDKYVADILKKFDFCSIKTATTPIESNKPLVKDEDGVEVDVHEYRSMIGSLMYLTASRPNIMFAVCACARFQVTPKASHLHATGKSTTGGCQFLGRRLISWQCKKQTIVANSTTEAEYVAAAHCCGQVLWIQNQMMDYGFNFMNTKIHIDNESTICVVKNPVYHSRTKHIEIRHHFIRDCYEKRLIDVLKIHTDSNVADLLTKGFDVTRRSMDLRMDRCSAGQIYSYLVFPMANLKYSDKHNMVAFLKKPNESVGFTEVVDFLKGTSLRYALTHNPTIYDSLVKQFWQTATVRTLANGTQQLVASIDSKEYIITEASVRSKLQLADATGIHNLSDAEIYAGLATLGYVTEGDIVPLLPAMLAGAAVDQGEGSAQPAEPHHTPVDPIPSTSHSPHPSPQHQSPHHSPPQPSPHFSPPRSYEAPLPKGNTSGSAEDSVQLKE